MSNGMRLHQIFDGLDLAGVDRLEEAPGERFVLDSLNVLIGAAGDRRHDAAIVAFTGQASRLARGATAGVRSAPLRGGTRSLACR